MTTVLNVKIMTAKANARVLRESSQKLLLSAFYRMTRCFVDACVACWQVEAGQQYKDLGYKSMTEFLKSESIDISRARYDCMANIGRMLEFVPDLERGQIIGIGYSCAKELARLAPTKDAALVSAADIVTLVNRRLSGEISEEAFLNLVREFAVV